MLCFTWFISSAGPVLPAVHPACRCSTAALQSQGVCWETLRLVCLWTQQETGEYVQCVGDQPSEAPGLKSRMSQLIECCLCSVYIPTSWKTAFWEAMRSVFMQSNPVQVMHLFLSTLNNKDQLVFCWFWWNEFNIKIFISSRTFLIFLFSLISFIFSAIFSDFPLKNKCSKTPHYHTFLKHFFKS